MPSLLFLVVTLLPIVSDASPINRQVDLNENVFMSAQNSSDGFDHRAVCFIDAVTYLDGESIPTSSPCEHCVCRPPGFACTITSCEYRPGCKAFRRSDQCCPEYQCECEKDGKIYQNGEKIMDSNNPCEVCYCQGGEIICAVIDCYWRNDCAPRYTADRCCPMYDHCPPPSAQGPIRHRLPSVPSLTSPISWHNITQAIMSPLQGSSSTQAPTTSQVTTESPSTTASTTTVAVTEEASSSPSTTTVAQVEAEVAQSDGINQVEPVRIDPAVVPASTYHGLEETLPAYQNDVVEGSQEEITPTSSVISVTVTSSVIESTTIIIPAALELTVQPTKVQHIHVVGMSTLSPSDIIVDNVLEIVTSEPLIQNLIQNDIPATTEQPSPGEEKLLLEDSPPVPADVTEKALPDAQDNSAFSDSVTDNVIQSENLGSDDIGEGQTTTLPVTNEITSDLEVNSNDLIRNDLSQPSTQSPLLDSSEDVISTFAPALNEVQNDEIYSDAQEEITTPRLSLQSEIQHEIASDPITTESPQFDDSLPEITTSYSVYNDDVTTAQPAGEEVAFDDVQQTSSPQVHDSPSTELPLSNDISEEIQISHDDVTEASPILHDNTESTDIQNDAIWDVHNDDNNVETTPAYLHDITESNIQNDDLESNDATESVPHSNDDSRGVTELPVHYNADPSTFYTTEPSFIQEDQPSQDSTEGVNPISNDDPSAGITEINHILQDEVTATPQSDEVATEKIYPLEEEVDKHQDVETEQETVTTERLNVLNDDVNRHIEHVVLEDATQRIFDDDTEEETLRPVNNVEAEVQDTPASTAVPLRVELIPKNNDNEVFDVILDDEVIPEQPEVLNQIRDVNEIQPAQHIVNDVVTKFNVETYEAYHPGVRVVDNDTIEVVNLSLAQLNEAGPLESSTQPATQAYSDTVVVENDEINFDSVSHDAPQTTSAPLNDEASNPSETEKSVGDQIDGKEAVFHNDDTTERLFRTDIHSGEVHDQENEQESTTSTPFALNVRSGVVIHETGEPHDHEEESSTGESVPVSQNDHLGEPHDHQEAEATTEAAPISYDNVARDHLGVPHEHEDVEPTTNGAVFVQDDTEEFSSDHLGVPHEHEEESTTTAANSRNGIVIHETGEPHDHEDESTTSSSLNLRSGIIVHETGEPHDHEEESSTGGSVPVLQHDHLGEPHDHGEESSTNAAAPILVNDEPTEEILLDEQSTLPPPIDIPVVGNKVQKVAQVLNRVSHPNSEESPGNQFRLELDIFRGSQESSDFAENEINEAEADVKSADKLESNPSAPTENLIVADSPVTSSPHVDERESDSATEANFSQDEAVTSRSEDISISQDTEVVENIFALEQTTVQPLPANDQPVGSTILPVQDDVVENDVVTNTYSLRTDILTSHEEAVEEQQDVDVAPTNIPVPLNDPVESITEEVIISQENLAPIHSVNVVADDEVTTESFSKFRYDIEILSSELPISNDVVTESNLVPEQNDFVEVSTSNPSGFQAIFREGSDSQVPSEVATEPSSSNIAASSNDESVTPVFDQVNELRSESLAISGEDTTVVNDPVAAAAQFNHVEVANPVVFADDTITTGHPLQKLRSGPVEPQQTETSQYFQDEAYETTEIPVFKENSSTPTVGKGSLEEIILPERGVPKIQPFAPDLSRSNPHELSRFDFQLPPEKDNSWLSRAVSQFRRLALFGSGSKSAQGGSTNTRSYNHRFLLF